MNQPRRAPDASKAAAQRMAGTIQWEIEAAYRAGLMRASTIINSYPASASWKIDLLAAIWEELGDGTVKS